MNEIQPASPGSAPGSEASSDTAIPFDLVGRGAEHGFFVIVAFDPAKTASGPSTIRAFELAESRQAQAFALELGQRQQVYLESSLQGDAPLGGKRGATASVSHCAVLTLDFDLRGGKHTCQALPDNPGDLDRLIQAAGAPKPTRVFSTGGGLLALWSLEEPFTIRTDAERTAVRSLAAAFQARLKKVARETFSWRLDGTQDLVRLIRIPGCPNHKYTPPRQVEVLS